jgi:quercetin dioxygenase-like cupin family protein
MWGKNSKMKTGVIHNNPPLSIVHSSHNASVLSLNLPVLIERMKHSDAWSKGELNAMILLKNDYTQIVLTAIHEGTEITSFQSNDSITFQIMEGRLKFHSRKESLTLDKGHLMTLHENVGYSLTTEEETVFLSTIASAMLETRDNN